MDNKISIGGICERDLDLCLQELFCVSEQFCIWFGRQVGIEGVTGSMAPAKRSKTDRTGESDLMVDLNVEQPLPARLLIENKITAAFQPMQAKRYKDRAVGYIEKGKANQCKTVLVAPEDYCVGDLKDFDARVSYEEVEAYLETADDFTHGLGKRVVGYKVALIQEALQRFVSNKTQTNTVFSGNYWTLVQEIAPKELSRKDEPKEIGDTMHFTGSKLAPNIYASHRLAQGKFGPDPHPEECLEYGNFDMVIGGAVAHIEEIRNTFRGKLPPHVEIVYAKGAVAFRIAVPQIIKGDQIEGAGRLAAAKTAIYLGRDLYRWFDGQRELWMKYASL